MYTNEHMAPLTHMWLYCVHGLRFSSHEIATVWDLRLKFTKAVIVNLTVHTLSSSPLIPHMLACLLSSLFPPSPIFPFFLSLPILPPFNLSLLPILSQLGLVCKGLGKCMLVRYLVLQVTKAGVRRPGNVVNDTAVVM